MDAELDYELTPDQWEMLKALRGPSERPINRPVVLQLVALGLAAFAGDALAITPRGRKVLVRGSEKLLDLAA